VLTSLALLVLATGALASCSDDDESDATSTTIEVQTETTNDAASDLSADDDAPVAGLTSAAICEALTPELVGEAIGLEVSDPEGADEGTPQCSYSFDADGVFSNVTVAAPDPDDDLGGRSGDEALEYSVELNESAVPGAEASDVEVEGADAAVLIESDVVFNLLVLVDGQILTVASSELDADQLTTLGAAAIVALTA
jgi:hypothetical protein